MLKKRRILLFLICVFIIGGIIFNAVYIRRKHEESIQDINIKKELGTDLLVDVKPWTKIDIHKWNSIFPKIMALKIIDLPVKKINCKTVVKHSSGIDYQKSELENKSTKKGQGIKIEIPAKKQDPAR